MAEKILADQKKFIIKTIFQFFPQVEILAFGSRIRGDAKTYSDLDLALKMDPHVSLKLSQIAFLEEAFSNSDLPFKVDLVIYSKVSAEFREIIDKSSVIWG